MRNKIEEKKQRLLKASDDYENLINQDITVISDTAREWGGRLLIIGGALIVSYLGVRAILGKRKARHGESEVEIKSMGKRTWDVLIKSLSDKAALVLLEIAREYIVKLISEPSKKHGR